ncbi:flagellar motor switch protein FliN [Telmatospirillum sp.]|uniref:flagellar motor switch protein FliN n=1 Tax=Telmatospirillum sp. TaxID=2079197 RepID=UPI00284B6610|nr:flagellar motor switch protein FliN [Telmatospirillum sp.]MDR3439307.1 flagellar motor switch protein FliN [Telmatospirillum sp.]
MADDDKDAEAMQGSAAAREAAYDIQVELYAVLGHANVQVKQLLKLGRGAVVELDRKINEPIDLFVNKMLVGRGEVVVVDDRLGVTVTDMLKGQRGS